MTEMEILITKYSWLLSKSPPSGINVTPLVRKRSPKSREGGKIHNPKIIKVFSNCMKLKNKAARTKTYCLLNRLINK